MPRLVSRCATLCLFFLTVVFSAKGQTTLTVDNTSGSGDIADFLTGSGSPVTKAEVDLSGDFVTGTSGQFLFSSFPAADTGLSRGSAGVVDVGTGTSGSAQGFVKSAQSLIVSSDFSTGSTSLTPVTGLSVALPLVVANWSFSCDLVISQTTATTGDAIGVQTPTNPPTYLTAGGVVGLLATGAIADGTKYAVHLGGGIVGTLIGGTVFRIVIATGNSLNLITVSAGSSCWVY
jgi:hypothetical protein